MSAWRRATFGTHLAARMREQFLRPVSPVTSAMVRHLMRGFFLMRWNWISKPQEGGQSLGKYLLS